MRAFIAHVESTERDDDARNALCEPVPHPDVPADWLRIAVSDSRAQMRWLRDPDLTRWLNSSRLNLVKDLFAGIPDDPDVRRQAVGSIGKAMEAMNERLVALTSD